MIVSTFRDLESLALTVWKLAGNEGQLCQTAVTWLIINRMRSEERAAGIPDICRHVLDDAVRAEADAAEGAGPPGQGAGSLADPRFCRLLIRILEVLAKDVNDPTDGARFLHRHDTVPDWSRGLEPVALIGAYFFYNCGGSETASQSVETAVCH